MSNVIEQADTYTYAFVIASPWVNIANMLLFAGAFWFLVLVTIKGLPIFLKYTEIYLKKFNLMESIIEIN